MVALVLLITLLTCWTNKEAWGAPDRDFRNIKQSEAVVFLKIPASQTTYIFYSLPGNWNLINTKFWDDVNLRLNEYAAHQEIVEPVKDQIIDNPCDESFYQKPVFIVLGISVAFIAGGVLGALIVSKLR